MASPFETTRRVDNPLDKIPELPEEDRFITGSVLDQHDKNYKDNLHKIKK